MTRTLSQLSMHAATLSLLGLTLAGCPVYLEDIERSDWWEDCDDGEWCEEWEGPHEVCPPDAGSTDVCSRNADCGEGRCQEGLCIPVAPDACAYDADCQVGFVCEEQLCEPSTVCTQNADCPDGLICDERSTCSLPADGECRADSDCGDNARCILQACQSLDDDICQFSNECGPGRACVDQVCTPMCEKHRDCPAGTRCGDGVCMPGGGNQCVLSSECAEGPCIDGHCATACEDDSACRDDLEVCGDDGLCRPDTAPRPFCTEDSECAAGHVCVEGVCRTPCPGGESVECLRFDSQLPICADNGLCYSMIETDPECAASADCPNGQRCVDAVCRN